ncbi:unnamed protein product [Diplocarpon coronariae]
MTDAKERGPGGHGHGHEHGRDSSTIESVGVCHLQPAPTLKLRIDYRATRPCEGELRLRPVSDWDYDNDDY